MDNRLTLSKAQRELLQTILYAKEKEAQLAILANAVEEPSYKGTFNYLENQAYGYDLVFWEALEALTGETVDTLLEGEEEVALKVDVRAESFRLKRVLSASEEEAKEIDRKNWE